MCRPIFPSAAFFSLHGEEKRGGRRGSWESGVEMAWSCADGALAGAFHPPGGIRPMEGMAQGGAGRRVGFRGGAPRRHPPLRPSLGCAAPQGCGGGGEVAFPPGGAPLLEGPGEGGQARPPLCLVFQGMASPPCGLLPARGEQEGEGKQEEKQGGLPPLRLPPFLHSCLFSSHSRLTGEWFGLAARGWPPLPHCPLPGGGGPGLPIAPCGGRWYPGSPGGSGWKSSRVPPG